MDELAVAIIGTRNPDQRQERKARFLAYHLSHHYGCRINTGGAYGIDQAAMLGARIDMLDICLPLGLLQQGDHSQMRAISSSLTVIGPLSGSSLLRTTIRRPTS